MRKRSNSASSSSLSGSSLEAPTLKDRAKSPELHTVHPPSHSQCMASRLLTVLSNSPSHHCDEGRRHALAAIVEQALVDEGEQRVENGTVSLSVPEKLS